MRYPSTFTEIHALEPPPSEKEREFLADCKAGEPCLLGSDRPEGPSPDREIRAEILRYAALGGCDENPTSAAGVQLRGAWISGQLDLGFATMERPLRLALCGFACQFLAPHLKLPMLALEGCRLPGLDLQGAEVAGDTLLRAVDEVAFHASGTVNVSGARIGRDLDFTGASFDAGAGKALQAQVLRVEGGLIWRGVSTGPGEYDLIAAQVGVLRDQTDSWPHERLELEAFTYERILGKIEVEPRLDWLRRGSRWGDRFMPQPYGQLAKVLRGMGHDRAAAHILEERERLIREDIRARLWVEPNGDLDTAVRSVWGSWKRGALWLWHGMERWIVGYGFKPARALLVLGGLFAIAWPMAFWAWAAGEFAPVSDVVLSSEAWASALVAERPAQAWLTTPEGASWESFSWFAYGLDVVVPLIEFGQTEAWAPLTVNGAGSPGYAMWWARWFLGAAGWIVAGVAAAGIAGALSPNRD